MADRTFNDVKINLTLKPQTARANVSSSQEDLAVQMGKIQQWYYGLNNYSTCATAAATAIKTVDCPGFELTTGAVVIVKFTVTNTAAVADLQLNVNGTGAKGIKYRNANLSTESVLTANRIYAMLYDGTYWQIIGDTTKPVRGHEFMLVQKVYFHIHCVQWTQLNACKHLQQPAEREHQKHSIHPKSFCIHL